VDLQKGSGGIIDHEAEFSQDGEEGLFALKEVNDQDAVTKLHTQGETGKERLENIMGDEEEENEANEADVDVDDSGDDEVEANLDELYNQYLARRKRKKEIQDLRMSNQDFH